MTGKKESQDSVLEMYQSIIDEKVWLMAVTNV
jgi:hypothetical protein